MKIIMLILVLCVCAQSQILCERIDRTRNISTVQAGEGVFVPGNDPYGIGNNWGHLHPRSEPGYKCTVVSLIDGWLTLRVDPQDELLRLQSGRDATDEEILRGIDPLCASSPSNDPKGYTIGMSMETAKRIRVRILAPVK